MYSKEIIEEFNNPSHYDNMRGADGVGKIVCDLGDEIIKIFIKVENDKIVDSAFQTFGGVVAIALTSFANKFLLGKTLADAYKIDVKDIMIFAGSIPENRMYLAHAVVSCAKQAIEDCKDNKKKDNE